ncbi:T9SS type A sorting domain-containing protein [Chryseobacterium binzhouense]|uniref:T9SS type A sorting domain-containing protein n=1 Tax=Chryseobacterium binzhouense TaxID=2593646 RepID=UPI0028A0F52A|nr:T9SS type A sorting domain-containing protein [Chryseobacterium binzhouense]
MKAKLLLASMISLGIQQMNFAQVDSNGYTTVNMSMGNSYQNRVFFDFSSNSSISQAADTWDIAFYRNSAMDKGIKVNDAKNITVYQISANPSDFDAVLPSQKATWGNPIYNPDQTTRIQDGAFDSATLLPSGPFNFGWGNYNIATHKVQGQVVFVLDYGNDNYYKFFINEFSAGYSFKYAQWNGTSWNPTQSKILTNGSDDAFFNYFSFTTGEKVNNMEPPKANWDLMFTRYYTNYVYPGGAMMYKMAGVIQNPNVTVARVQPETQATSTVNLPASSAFSSTITAVGHSWKPTSGAPLADVVYYVKQGSDYYRMYFITNEGTSTGNMYFKYKNITSTLGVKEIGKKAAFGIYPNPTTADKKVTVLFDVKEKAENKGSVEVFDLSGKRVYQSELTNREGFYKQDLNLSHLTTGNYLVKITYGGQTETKKLIVK